MKKNSTDSVGIEQIKWSLYCLHVWFFAILLRAIALARARAKSVFGHLNRSCAISTICPSDAAPRRNPLSRHECLKKYQQRQSQFWDSSFFTNFTMICFKNMNSKFLTRVDKQNLHNCEDPRALSTYTTHSHGRIPAKLIDNKSFPIYMYYVVLWLPDHPSEQVCTGIDSLQRCSFGGFWSSRRGLEYSCWFPFGNKHRMINSLAMGRLFLV